MWGSPTENNNQQNISEYKIQRKYKFGKKKILKGNDSTDIAVLTTCKESKYLFRFEEFYTVIKLYKGR